MTILSGKTLKSLLIVLNVLAVVAVVRLTFLPTQKGNQITRAKHDGEILAAAILTWKESHGSLPDVLISVLPAVSPLFDSNMNWKYSPNDGGARGEFAISTGDYFVEGFAIVFSSDTMKWRVDT